MNIVILVLFILALASTNAKYNPKLVDMSNSKEVGGGYKYSFKFDDGTNKEEEAEVVNKGLADEHLIVTGSYSYVGDDGRLYSVEYTADKDGFHPSGNHLPQSAGVNIRAPPVFLRGGIPRTVLNSLSGGGIGK